MVVSSKYARPETWAQKKTKTKLETHSEEEKCYADKKYGPRCPRSTYDYVEYSSKNAVFMPKRKTSNGPTGSQNQAKNGILMTNGEKNFPAENPKNGTKKNGRKGRHRVLPLAIEQPMEICKTDSVNKNEQNNQRDNPKMCNIKEFSCGIELNPKNNSTSQNRLLVDENWLLTKELQHEQVVWINKTNNTPENAEAVVESTNHQIPCSYDAAMNEISGNTTTPVYKIKVLPVAECTNVVNTSSNKFDNQQHEEKFDNQQHEEKFDNQQHEQEFDNQQHEQEFDNQQHEEKFDNQQQEQKLDKQHHEQIFYNQQRKQEFDNYQHEQESNNQQDKHEFARKLHTKGQKNQFQENCSFHYSTYGSKESFTRTQKFLPKKGNNTKIQAENIFVAKQNYKNVQNTQASKVKLETGGFCNSKVSQYEGTAEHGMFEKRKYKPQQDTNDTLRPKRDAPKISTQTPQNASAGTSKKGGNYCVVQKPQVSPPVVQILKACMNAVPPAPITKLPIFESAFTQNGRVEDNKKSTNAFITPCEEKMAMMPPLPATSMGPQYMHYNDQVASSPQYLLPSPQQCAFPPTQLLPLPHQFPLSYQLPLGTRPVLSPPPPIQREKAYINSVSKENEQLALEQKQYIKKFKNESPSACKDNKINKSTKPKKILNSKKVMPSLGNSSTNHDYVSHNSHESFSRGEKIANNSTGYKKIKHPNGENSEYSRSTSASAPPNSAITPESSSIHSQGNSNYFGSPMASNVSSGWYGVPSFYPAIPVFPPFQQPPLEKYIPDFHTQNHRPLDISWQEVARLPVGTFVVNGCMYFPHPANPSPF